MKQNLLQYYVSLLRTNKDTQVSSERKEQCVTALHNAIRTMCFSRNNKICGENFSNLDFGNIPLNGIKFSVDGYVPSSFSGSTLHEWNLYSGHRFHATSACFSGNGMYIITSDEEGKVIVWNVERKLVQNQYSIENDRDSFHDSYLSFFYSPYSAAISQNGNFFATSCKRLHRYREFGAYLSKRVNKESIKIWETSTGNHYCIPEYCCNLDFKFPVMEFSHDEHYLITGYSDNKASIWDTSTGEFVRDLVGHEKEVTSVGFSEDDTVCITGSEDHTAKIWDAKTGKCINTLNKNGHKYTITAVAISNDKHYYLTGASDGTVKLWTSDGNCKYTSNEHDTMVKKVRFAPNCKQCITMSSDGAIKVWSLETRKLICTRWWRSRTIQFIFADSDIFYGNYIYLYNGGFMIKELESDLIISDFNYHYCFVIDTSVSCNYFLAGVSNNHVILFDKNQKKKICDFDFSISDKYDILESVDISSDEHFFMTYFRISNMIIIYNMHTKEIVNTIDKYTNIIKVSFVPKHDWIFVLTDDGIGRYLDIKTRKCVCLFDRDKREMPLSLDFSQNGQYCFCKYADGTFVLWKFGNKKPIHFFELEDVDHSFCSVSSKYCAIITKNLKIWDIQAEELLDNNYWGVSLDEVKMFYLLCDGDYFVIGKDDSQDYKFDQKVSVRVKMFETESGDCIKDFSTSHLGFIKWQFPYYVRFRDNYVDIYELDFFSSEDEILSTYIGRFYLIDDLNVKGCDFSNIDADDVIKDIISQYGGDL